MLQFDILSMSCQRSHLVPSSANFRGTFVKKDNADFGKTAMNALNPVANIHCNVNGSSSVHSKHLVTIQKEKKVHYIHYHSLYILVLHVNIEGTVLYLHRVLHF